MDIRTRTPDLEELIRSAIDERLSRLWTSAPGTVVPGSYDRQKQTVSVQLSVKGFLKKEDGTQSSVDLPVLTDVPVQFPSGGGVTMTFPIKGGEEVLVNFAARAPGAWQQSSGQQNATDAAMHSLSNGFAQLGYRSNPKALQDVDEDSVSIRSDDNNTKVSLNPGTGVSVSTNKTVTIAAAEGIALAGGTGNVSIDGDLIISGISFLAHVHTGVQPGGGLSGPPNGA